MEETENMRKHNVNEINLKIESVHPFVREKTSGIFICWSSDIGFGEYVIISVPSPFIRGETDWVAETECMDCMDDKDFGLKLMELWIQQIIVIE